MRKMLFYPFHQLKADVRIVYGIDQYFRLFGAGRFQQVDPGGIAVENLHIKFAQGINMIRVVIEDNHLHPAGEQQSPGNLPEAAKAGNNHPRLLFINLVSIPRLAAGRFLQTGQQDQQDRRYRHRQRHRQGQRLSPFAVQHIRHPRGAKDHKRELASLPQQHRKPAALGAWHAQRPGDKPQHQHFYRQETDQQNNDTQRMGHESAEVNRHADADKEQPQQQPFKRLDIALQRMTILGAGQQHPGEKRPHRHRQPDFLQQQSKAEDQEQRHGAEHFAQARTGDKAQQRTGQIAPQGHHQRQRRGHLQRGEGKRHQRGGAAAGRQQGDHRHQWDRRDILEQQHREGAPPHLRHRQIALIHRLHRNGCGRERQGHAYQLGHLPAQAQQHAEQTDQYPAGHHLQRAAAEHRGA